MSNRAFIDITTLFRHPDGDGCGSIDANANAIAHPVPRSRVPLPGLGEERTPLPPMAPPTGNRILGDNRILKRSLVSGKPSTKPHWSKEEVKLLKRLKEERGYDFKDMAAYFNDPSRSAKALSVKYSKLGTAGTRRPRWTDEETQKLVTLKREQPDASWSRIASHFVNPPRSSYAIVLKWNSLSMNDEDENPEVVPEMASEIEIDDV